MSVTDFHVHRPTTRGVWGNRDYTASAYAHTMDAAGVDRAVVLPLDGLVYGPGATNDEVASWCAELPDRLLPFGTADARQAGALDEMTRCVEELGMLGFKFHPWMQGFYVLDPTWRPLFERARDLAVPVLLHDGTPPDSAPLQVAQLALEVPGLNVVLGHGGLHDYWQEAIEAARLSPNVHIAMTSLPYGAMQRMVDAVPASQLLFGSDGGCGPDPFQPYVLDRWQTFGDLRMDAATRSAITVDNPHALLGV